MRRCRRLGYCGSDISTVAEMFDEADETLFHRILANNNHVLQSYNFFPTDHARDTT